MKSTARQHGSVTVTPMELRKKQSARTVNAGSSAGIPLRKQTFVKLAAAWTASGSLYYVDCQHNLRTTSITVQGFNTLTSDDIFFERINRAPNGDTDYVRLFVSTPPDSTTITII